MAEIMTTKEILSSGMRTLEETERSQIRKILSETQWRIEGNDGAAEILGLHPEYLESEDAQTRDTPACEHGVRLGPGSPGRSPQYFEAPPNIEVKPIGST